MGLPWQSISYERPGPTDGVGCLDVGLFGGEQAGYFADQIPEAVARRLDKRPVLGCPRAVQVALPGVRGSPAVGLASALGPPARRPALRGRVRPLEPLLRTELRRWRARLVRVEHNESAPGARSSLGVSQHSALPARQQLNRRAAHRESELGQSCAREHPADRRWLSAAQLLRVSRPATSRQPHAHRMKQRFVGLARELLELAVSGGLDAAGG
jgi:hypothetical protein